MSTTEPSDLRPRPDEVEISVFGPGVGESIVVHLGADEWMVVDSCRDRSGPQPRAAALAYFERIGVDPTDAVQTIVATHWDSDHIRALGEVVEACPDASFWCPAALGAEEFDVIMDLLGDNPARVGQRLGEIVSIVATRRRRLGHSQGSPAVASDSSMLLRRPARGGLPVREVHALSPSSQSVLVAVDRLKAGLGNPKKLRRRLNAMSRNDTSIVLSIAFGEHGALLGADLERSADPARGWTCALRRASELELRSSLVKVPHHGSDDAHDPEMWETGLHPGPAAVVTPFFGSSDLPKPEDRTRIREYASQSFLTTDRVSVDDEPSLLELSLPALATVKRIEGAVGHVRWRRPMDGSAPWQAALDEHACAL